MMAKIKLIQKECIDFIFCHEKIDFGTDNHLSSEMIVKFVIQMMSQKIQFVRYNQF